MNRRKKINETLKKKAKKMNAKRNPKNKPKYISKAERAKMADVKMESDSENLSVDEPKQPTTEGA